MDITKHLVKPVKTTILGEEVEMKPLRVKHYTLVSRYQYLALKAQALSKQNEKEGTSKELSSSERDELFRLDSEISYLILSETFKDLTKEEFGELPIDVVNQVMAVFWKLNNPDDDELEEAKKQLLE